MCMKKNEGFFFNIDFNWLLLIYVNSKKIGKEEGERRVDVWKL